MASTPRNAAHLGSDPMASPFGSPASDVSSEAGPSSSTLQYVNSQLVAHGFSISPGLCLDGISRDHGEQIVKCIMGLLSQRMGDMRRTEDLTAKFRILTYDYERLTSMHRTSVEQAAAAEREMNLSKSRLAAANRTLQSEKAAHRHTIAELHRTRSSLLTVRQAHAQEIKRHEKETERILDRWSKISDSQIKMSSCKAGLTFKLTCANANVGSNPEAILGKGKNLLEQALDDAEEARAALGDENKRLKKIFLDAVNEIQEVLHSGRSTEKENDPEPTPYTLTTLFPMAPIFATNERVSSLLQSLRETIKRLSEAQPTAAVSTLQASPSANPKAIANEQEVTRLRTIVKDLQTEMSKAGPSRSDTGNDELVRNKETDDLNKSRKDLIKSKAKLKETAAQIEAEKTQLERERAQFLEEKREWQTQLNPDNDVDLEREFPPHVMDNSALAKIESRSLRRSVKSKGVLKSPSRASRRSPGKPSVAFAVPVGKAGLISNKRIRFSLSPRSSQKVIPPFETEVMISTQPLIIPETFVLPPPSPLSAFPERQDILAHYLPPQDEQSISDGLPRSRTTPDLHVIAINSETEALLTGAGIAMSPSVPNLQSFTSPEPISNDRLAGLPSAAQSTPLSHLRPFPMAKPLASRMIHAYSPARPSPLSRILMLDDSPLNINTGIDIPDAIPEDEEEMPNQLPVQYMEKFELPRIDDDGLAMTDDELDDSPLREKQGRLNAAITNAKLSAMGMQNKIVPQKETSKPLKSGKPKLKQKENTATKSSKSTSGTTITELNAKVGVASSSLASKPLLSGKMKGGARRVPANSAEAAPMVWRG